MNTSIVFPSETNKHKRLNISDDEILLEFLNDVTNPANHLQSIHPYPAITPMISRKSGIYRDPDSAMEDDFNSETVAGYQPEKFVDTPDDIKKRHAKNLGKNRGNNLGNIPLVPPVNNNAPSSYDVENTSDILKILGDIAGVAARPSITQSEIISRTKPTDISGDIRQSFGRLSEISDDKKNRSLKELLARVKQNDSMTGQFETIAKKRNDEAKIKALNEKNRIYEKWVDKNKEGKLDPTERQNKQFAKEFFRDQKTVKDQEGTVRRAYQNVLSAARNPGKSGLSQVQAVYNLIKLWDPNAVKEGEIALAQSAVPLYDRLVGLYDKYKEGKVFPPEVMGEVLKTAGAAYDIYREEFNGRIADYQNMAKTLDIGDKYVNALGYSQSPIDVNKDFEDTYKNLEPPEYKNKSDQEIWEKLQKARRKIK